MLSAHASSPFSLKRVFWIVESSSRVAFFVSMIVSVKSYFG